MEISARIRNTLDDHSLSVSTAGHAQSLRVSAKPGGRGSAVNGGELLAAALATCYCNDLYREADRLGIGISACEVIATVQFGAVGQAATVVTYAARVESRAPADEVERLLCETDRLAEVHNTLRSGCAVERVAWPRSGN